MNLFVYIAIACGIVIIIALIIFFKHRSKKTEEEDVEPTPEPEPPEDLNQKALQLIEQFNKNVKQIVYKTSDGCSSENADC